MSGVKVTNERSSGPIPAIESVDGEVDGDNVDWEPGEAGISELDQWKQPVRVATTANITIATALNAGDTIDGVTLVAGDRVLVKDQSSAIQNGIYVAGSTPARAIDLDDDDEVLGAVVYVIAGTANAGTTWAVTNTAATTVDTDAIAWAAVGGGSGSIPAHTYELANEGGDPLTHSYGNLGSTKTIDPTDGNALKGTLNANCTVTVAAPSGTSAVVSMRYTQDATGGRTLSHAGSVTMLGSIDATALASSLVIYYTDDGGTNWIAFVAGGSGSALTIKDEGTPLATAATSIDVVGAAVVASGAGAAKTITVSALLPNEGEQATIKAHGSMGATETFDPTDGNVHTGTLNASCTFTLNAPSGTGFASLELWLTEDGTGGWTVTWPGSVTELGTHDTTALTMQRVILESADLGTSWIATWIGSGEPIASAHIADTADAHDASAVSVLDTGGYYTGTDVEAVLAEIPAQIATVAAAAAASASGSHAHIMDCLFSGDASTTAFTLPAVPYDQYSVAAYVSGVLTEVTLSGTLFDIATFGSAPASATNNIRFDIVAATV